MLFRLGLGPQVRHTHIAPELWLVGLGGIVFEKLIARQPIFYQRLKVFAYELLFRAGTEDVFRPRKEASSSTIVDSVMLFDLAALTGCAKPFLNFDEPALQRGAARLLPPDRVVIEILETVTPTPDVIRLCKELSDAGYVLALDDYIGHPKWEPLIPLVKFIKADFRDADADSDARRAIAERFRNSDLHLLVEKLETQAELQEARSLGYSFFQGFFFCKPATGFFLPRATACHQQVHRHTKTHYWFDPQTLVALASSARSAWASAGIQRKRQGFSALHRAIRIRAVVPIFDHDRDFLIIFNYHADVFRLQMFHDRVAGLVRAA
jgi:hypothetical protein